MATKSPRLARKNSLRKNKAISTDDISIPGQLQKAELDSLVCHFNWEICEVTSATLQERINAVEGHIRENSVNILPQSYCLLAYLKRKIKADKQEVYDDLLTAEMELPVIDTTSEKLGIGYKAVILGNLIVWESELKKHKLANEHFKEYQEIKKKYKGDLSEHPEALAMKAFAFGYSFGHNKSCESAEAYLKALSDVQYKDKVEWLFGLALSKTLIAYKMEPPLKEDLSDIEDILRRVIHLDPTYFLAMLKLAKTLVKLNGVLSFEEVEYWIQKALNESNRKLTILEEAASIYLMTARNKDGNNDEAMKLFEEAEKIDSNSKRTMCGLGQCYFNLYFNNRKKKSSKVPLPEELMKAQKYFERDIINKRHADHLKLAHVYLEISKFKGKKDYLKKAEDIYIDIIAKTEEEKDTLHIVEAYSKYAIFLKKNNRIKEEIDYLLKVVKLNLGIIDENEYEMRFVHECQDKLLEYASNNDLMTENKSFALKGFIQEKRGNIQSAIFYLKKAIEVCDSDMVSKYRLQEDLAEYLLEASKIKHHLVIDDVSQRCFIEATQLIETLENTNRKCDLEFKAIEIKINESMGEKELEELKKYRIDFEQYHVETNKKMLKKNVRFFEEESDNENQRKMEEMNQILKVIKESKCLLDRGMNSVKVEVFKKENNKPPYCYYPSPKTLKSTKKFDVQSQMEHLLHKMWKLPDFKATLPALFDFLVGKQPKPLKLEYKWLQDFIDIRNEEEHYIRSQQLLENTFTTREERTLLVRNVSMYAVECWKRFNVEIKNYMLTTKL